MAAPALTSRHPRQRRRRPLGLFEPLVVGLFVFLVARTGGAFATHPRLTLGVLIWIAVALLFGLGMRVPAASRDARVVALCLTGYALWTLASAWWGPAEPAYLAFTQALLLTGSFLLASIVLHGLEQRIVGGLALGLSAVALLALATRLVPDVISAHVFAREPGWETRLSYPLGYWNGLGILVALALPLLVATAARSTASSLLRALVLIFPPIVGATIYLTSSRGGVAVGLVGVLLVVILAASPLTVSGATLVLVGAVAGALEIRHYPVLANGPLGTSNAAAQGHRALAVLALTSVALAGVGTFALAVSGRARAQARFARVVVAVILVGLVVLAVAANPDRRLKAFEAAPSLSQSSAQQHILSGGGSGRWQFWTAAVDEFRHHPVVGGGAGTFAAWWAQHGSLSLVTHDAHSLYLQTLGELGLVGFVLLLAALGAAAVFGHRRVRAEPDGDRRTTTGALLATFVAYLVALGIDWMWTMTVVSLVGMIAIGALLSTQAEPDGPRRGVRFSLALLSLAAAAALLLPLAVDTQLNASAARTGRGDFAGAVRAANSGHALEPWASSPFLQLALTAEAAGDYRSAEKWISAAINRNESDWHLWYVAARLHTRAGHIRDARRSLAQVRRLTARRP